MAIKFVTVLLLCMITMPGEIQMQMQQCPTTGCSCPQYTCCLSVVENSEPGTPIGIASSNVDFLTLQNVTNPQYTVVGGDSSNQQQFTVNRDTGEIATAVEFDREAIDDNCVSFGIQVTNSDDGSTNVFSFAVEILDVNDNPPQFSRNNFTINIDETTTDQADLSCPGGPQAILAASDQDKGENGTVSYSIAAGSGDDTFRVPDPSNPCVVNIVDLDRDTPPTSYSLVLIAQDHGTPSLNSSTTVTFTLNDINDNPPMFNSSQINVTILENAIPNTVVHQFAATDIDKEGSVNIEYVLSLSLDQNIPFEINSTTGELKLTETLDAESRPEYIATVSATDTGGLTGSTSVTILVEDVNEAKLVTVTVSPSGQEQLSLTEEEISTAQIAFQFSDIEATSANQNNSVEILSGGEFFQVTESSFGDSFNFIIMQSTPIDRETNATVNLVIQVIQGGNPPFIENHTFTYTILDKNDNAPYMPQQNIQFTETEHGPDDVEHICSLAMDDDVGENGTVISFELLSVLNAEGIDITDRFARAMMNSRNDNSEDGNNCILFAPAIDREIEGDILTVNVLLIDGGTPPMNSTQSFVIDIIDINDNSPEFSQPVYQFNVSENVANAVVGIVEALDFDESLNGKVSYFLKPDPDAPFSINSSTGEIKANRVLDREEHDSFTIYVNASDNGSPPIYSQTLAKIQISITDLNDNFPTFSEPSISISIDSSVSVGEVVATLMAADQDLPPNARIIYRLESFSEYFSVNSSSGEVKVKQQLPSEETTYHLLISAYNQEFYEQRNTINVTIDVSKFEPLSLPLVGGVAGAVVVFIILIVIVFCITICLCFKNKRKGKYDVEQNDSQLNNNNHSQTDSSTKSILKSATQGNGITTRDRSVQFLERATETHYDQQQSVTGDHILRKETITNFGSSDESPLTPPHVPNGNIGNSSQEPIMDLDMSPRGNGITGNHIPGLHQRYIHPGDDPELMGYSQDTNNTAEDINTYNSDGEDDDSTMSDDASNTNGPISHFGRTTGEHPITTELSIEMRYPYHHPHSHLVPHPHAPHNMSPNHHHHGPVAPLRADILAAHNAETNRYNSPHNDDVTPTHNGHQHESILSHHTSTPTHPHLAHTMVPHHAMPHISSTPPMRHGPVPTANRHFPHPFVFPDAYPRGTPDGAHRFDSYIHSLSDYGDASTYASTELNEALGFHTLDAEPEICSLTATDYDDSEESRL